jgi:uncharacterized protein
MHPKPFIHAFQINDPQAYFVYDIGTNLILEVADVVYDILIGLGRCPEEQIAVQLQSKYPSDKISEAFTSIDTFTKDYGVFQERKSIHVTYPKSRQELEECLKTQVAHIILNITENCNLRCQYCRYGGTYSWGREHRNVHMPESIAISAIDLLAKHAPSGDGVLSIGFYGGEPLLQFDLIKRIVRYARRKLRDRATFSMTTNGTLLKEEVVRFLIEESFSLNVSVDGPSGIHDRYRRTIGGEGSFSQVKENLMRIKSINPEYFETRVGLFPTISPPFDLRSVWNFFRDCELGHHALIRTNMVDMNDTSFFDQFDKELLWDNFVVQKKDLKAGFLNDMRNRQKRPPDAFLWSMFGTNVVRVHERSVCPLKETVYPNGICLPGTQRLFVSTEGHLGPCEKAPSLIIGHVNKGVDPDRVQSMINQYIECSAECASCWAIRMCDACFVGAVKNGSLDITRKQEFCKLKRSAIHETLNLYCALLKSDPSALSDMLTARR